MIILKVLLFIVIQILFIPVAIIGLVIALYKELYISKKLGISFSAIKALQYRWLMHYFNTRKDVLSVKFIKNFPCESHFGMWSIMGALIISNRLLGFPRKLGVLVEQGYETADTTAGIRVIRFDEIIKKYLDEVDQIVIPGAGFDLLTLHFTKDKNVKVYEIDQEHTLKIKIDTLNRANIKHDWITYIPVDYNQESWSDKLLDAGFDRNKKTLFIWQSVSLYLDREVVTDTIRSMSRLSAPGSIITQDFYSTRFVSGEYSREAKKFMGIIEKMGEQAKFGLEMENNTKESVETFVNECGLEMTKYIQFGEKIDIEPFYCIVESKIK